MTVRGACQLVTGPLVALFVLGPALNWTVPVAAFSSAPVPGHAEKAVPVAEQESVTEQLDAAGFPLLGLRAPAQAQPSPALMGVAPAAADQAAPPPVAAAAARQPGCAGTSAGAFTPGAAQSGPGATPVAVGPGNGRRVPVSNAAALTAALASARPGDTIELADGRYQGKFVLSRSGTAASPITLVGSCRAVLDGGSGTGYVLHMNGADHWRLAGFTVSGAEKGIMTDRTNHAVLSHLTVGDTGAEAVHFRNFSSDNTVQSTVIHNTGKTKPQYGEGLYFGSAKSNWKSNSGGQPDASNNNRALGNAFRAITAENIDVKEATSGGLIAGNMFDGSGITGDNFADSVLDMKGVRYRVVDNRTSGASPMLKSGFQTHVITDPASSGCGNTFSGNTFPGLNFADGKAIELDKKCG